jgi:hypothetical protein
LVNFQKTEEVWNSGPVKHPSIKYKSHLSRKTTKCKAKSFYFIMTIGSPGLKHKDQLEDQYISITVRKKKYLRFKGPDERSPRNEEGK